MTSPIANHDESSNTANRLLLAAAAAFAAYFCMYAFRKPFTAATFEGLSLWGLGFKTVLVFVAVVRLHPLQVYRHQSHL